MVVQAREAEALDQDSGNQKEGEDERRYSPVTHPRVTARFPVLGIQE